MLPKPSPLSLTGDAEQQTRYIITYLQTLVDELERRLGNKSGKAVDKKCVTDVGINNAGKLVVTYTDGSVKYITIGE